MGLTNSSVSMKVIDAGMQIKRKTPEDKVIALAGNPNVGKSTVFNALTGMNQHTGNWPGKTVTSSQGYCFYMERPYIVIDLPGTYSLMAHSAEEEVARDFICFGAPDTVVVVCDATCLERNMNLVLQTIEIAPKVILCVNLMDEAKRKGIKIDLKQISKKLGIPAVGVVAREKKGMNGLLEAVNDTLNSENQASSLLVSYPQAVEAAISVLEPIVSKICGKRIESRWLSLRLMEQDDHLMGEAVSYLGEDFLKNQELKSAIALVKDQLFKQKITREELKDTIASSLVNTAEKICSGAVTYEKEAYHQSDLKIDRILTSKRTGYPIMLALLGVVFWLTIAGANYPSQIISSALFWLQDRLTDVFHSLGAPGWLHGILILGVYRVLAWVVSVMLPPMAIFFPLFTILEDSGYLPRIAYNLDKPFKRCCACGKQALTMCIGFIYLQITVIPITQLV